MDARDSALSLLASTVVDPRHAFPTLTPAQIARMEARGRRRQTVRGEVLYDAGDRGIPLFVVLSGALQVVRPEPGDTLIATHAPHQFSGECSVITGRQSIFRARVSDPGEVIQIDREPLLELVQTDAELSEILLGAFLQRRLGLIAGHLADVVVVGSTHDPETLHVREFLIRNGHPFQYLDVDRDPDAQEMIDRFDARAAGIPIVVCRGHAVLHRPTNARIAECLGLNDGLDATRVADLAIVGAGPAGLAAAVYGASEGLNVLVIESNVPGGQAGSSSRIENYLGFPTGISGLELTTRAYSQALKFGAQVVVASRATRLTCDDRRYVVDIDEGPRITARAVIVATGAHYRKPQVDGLSLFEGAGVYYAATSMEAQLCAGDEVAVVGGGNSAGQAAVFLASTARRVHMLVRGPGLGATMSRYLSRRIEAHPAICLRTLTTVIAVEGDGRLERIRWRDERTGHVETIGASHLFIMTGAAPNTSWLNDCVPLDQKGFVKTGADLSVEDLAGARWPLARAPYLLETSRPGIFAVGDVRSGTVKRVASAVGEGSIAVAFAHQFLQQ